VAKQSNKSQQKSEQQNPRQPVSLDDPDLKKGYQFGSMYKTETPLDFMDSPETGLRPKSLGKKPEGFTTVDISNGIKDWHVIPPVAIWERGLWFDSLKPEDRKGFRVDDWDVRQTYLVPGEGTPGNYAIRLYIVPTKIAEQQECKHPLQWTKFQRDQGDNKAPSLGMGGSYTGWGGGYTPAKTTTPVKPKPPPMPSGIVMRCLGCGHWFDGETKLAGHATHCCPGSKNWEDERGADWVLPCKCCLTWDETAICKPGYPVAPKVADEKKEVGAEPVLSGA